jgi:TonB family protein
MSSTAASANEYRPTLIETGSLATRLAGEIKFFKIELKRAWIDVKKNPSDFGARVAWELLQRSRTLLTTPNAIALLTFVAIVTTVLLFDRARPQTPGGVIENALEPEVVMLEVKTDRTSNRNQGIGRDGKGRVGFQRDKGEGSGPKRVSAQGGGSGGEGDPMPPQVGKLPPPSTILASIPKSPPLHAPTLPVAGIDIDPALWKDLKAPVYGDPRSNSEVPSKGPGDGGGIGNNQGLGIGNGSGPGYGPGKDGNTGGGAKQTGCCGSGGTQDGSDRPFRGGEVEQRARLLSKPEPQYTEEARRNQITGTVTLRVVFSSTGEVVQIRAVNTLPFGLTERAIAAARQIRFIPAAKGGHPVSVFMQLEYNFNLY